MLWLMFNVFIYSPEIRYKSDSTILLWDDKARSGPFTEANFFSTPMETSLSVFFKSFYMDERNGEISCMVGRVLVLERDVYRWPGPLTNITIEEIFISF